MDGKVLKMQTRFGNSDNEPQQMGALLCIRALNNTTNTLEKNIQLINNGSHAIKEACSVLNLDRARSSEKSMDQFGGKTVAFDGQCPTFTANGQSARGVAVAFDKNGRLWCVPQITKSAVDLKTQLIQSVRYAFLYQKRWFLDGPGNQVLSGLAGGSLAQVRAALTPSKTTVAKHLLVTSIVLLAIAAAFYQRTLTTERTSDLLDLFERVQGYRVWEKVPLRDAVVGAARRAGTYNAAGPAETAHDTFTAMAASVEHYRKTAPKELDNFLRAARNLRDVEAYETSNAFVRAVRWQPNITVNNENTRRLYQQARTALEAAARTSAVFEVPQPVLKLIRRLQGVDSLPKLMTTLNYLGSATWRALIAQFGRLRQWLHSQKRSLAQYAFEALGGASFKGDELHLGAP